MPSISKFAAVLTALAVGVQAIEAPIAGYGVEELTWEVEYEAGKTTELNGTVQEVHDQLLQLNPEYEVQFGTVEENAAIAEKRSAQEVKDILEKRDFNVCGNGPNKWYPAHCVQARNAVNYLRGVPGRPSSGPGPGNCARVSCGYGAGVWWCNDNRSSYTLGSFNDIANAGTVILNDCSWGGDGYIIPCWVVGQRFHNDNINVIVRGEGC